MAPNLTVRTGDAADELVTLAIEGGPFVVVVGVGPTRGLLAGRPGPSLIGCVERTVPCWAVPDEEPGIPGANTLRHRYSIGLD